VMEDPFELVFVYFGFLLFVLVYNCDSFILLHYLLRFKQTVLNLVLVAVGAFENKRIHVAYIINTAFSLCSNKKNDQSA